MYIYCVAHHNKVASTYENITIYIQWTSWSGEILEDKTVKVVLQRNGTHSYYMIHCSHYYTEIYETRLAGMIF